MDDDGAATATQNNTLGGRDMFKMLSMRIEWADAPSKTQVLFLFRPGQL